ncbi:MAG TPA: hypothetical protein QF353_04140 [Gammaproteobacteria bacterium]|nr:hypothetical protein [Gammaproteobacteria bacterium]
MGWLLGELSLGLLGVNIWCGIVQDMYGAIQIYSYRYSQVDQSLLKLGGNLLQLNHLHIKDWGPHYVCGSGVCFRYKRGRGLMQCQNNYCEIKNEQITVFKVKKKFKNIIHLEIGWQGFQVDWVATIQA